MTEGIHLISNGKQSLEEFIKVSKAVSPYVNYIHIREKHRTDDELVEWISELVKNDISKGQLVMNERVELAVRTEIKGVQLTDHSEDVSSVRMKYPNLLIGRSVHSVEEAQDAAISGADYVIFGHIFKTNSKPGLLPRGLEQLGHLIKSVDIPVIAVGGITPKRVESVMTYGASGVAIMSGLIDSEKPIEEAKHFLGGVRDGSSR
ncbi:thiamine phosphate synthase [Alkalibacillus salilacus]|uniref:Thiazole tautomerase (Transcriptional regulator TenI) n=1 Tax=Alkalibacillus salilacus TaxID=284582 RepID=A0ABT9VH28_9BACI|nr:thiamine phosphate synthase [Alkalibacillus salilacus]MDQ0160261.1 thiazole tautomerase (transcriptional regulator TenI) [Alkalibacillus salilacus]